MKRAAVLALVAAACTGSPDTDSQADAGSAAQPLFGADYAQTHVQVRDCRFSIEHDGVYIRVRANALAAATYADAGYPFAEGSVVLKEEFLDAACQNPSGFTAMRRSAQPEFAQTGGWQWQRLDAERRVTQNGALTRCYSCHSGCTNGRDGTCTDP